MVGCHHQLNGHESEQTPGDSEGQGSLACCSPPGRKESNTTELLNNNIAEAGVVNVFFKHIHKYCHFSNQIFLYILFLKETEICL